MGGIGTPQNLFTACPWCKRLMMLSGDCISVDQLVLVKQEWENKSYPGKHIIVAAIAHKHGSVIASDIMDALNLSNALKYDVALSFASEDRGKARALAELLTEAGYSVFYDEYAKSELWGKNLYDHLVRVYKDESRFCVVFASTHYQSKVWTNHERQAAQARALKDKKEYLLPIRIDDTEIPGLPATIGYIDWHTTTPNEVFQLLREKLEMPD
jgi:hypothetical protein